jgi:hypothetical protein
MMDARASRKGDYERDLSAIMTKLAERWPGAEETSSSQGQEKRAREQLDKNKAKSAKKAKP